VKEEAAALSVHAQRCQFHYFSTTPRTWVFFWALCEIRGYCVRSVAGNVK